MAKEKEKRVNPATAALKASKTRAIKKGKAEAAAKRTDRLSKINPAHLQRKIEELESAGGAEGKNLKPFERQRLDELRKQLKGVEKARGDLGDKAPSFRERRDGFDGARGRGGGVLGKRRRGDDRGRDGAEESSETDEDVKDIPMPTDVENMPPVPRRSNRNRGGRGGHHQQEGDRKPHELPDKPPTVERKTVYSSAPVLRNLEKEATSRFVPAAVAQKLKQAKGESGLLEPEELDRLEKLGYRNAAKADAKGAVDEAEKEAEFKMMNRQVLDGGKARNLDEEERRFEEELREIEMEDVATTKQSALEAVRHVVDEAIHEADFRMMADEAGGGPSGTSEQQAQLAEKHLKYVEVEEVSDEDL